MRVVSSLAVSELIHDQGGRLYVWLKHGRCCGSLITLAAATSPPPGKEFRRIEHADFELYLPSSLQRVPNELQLELRRHPRRVEAYWNGCAWVI